MSDPLIARLEEFATTWESPPDLHGNCRDLWEDGVDFACALRAVVRVLRDPPAPSRMLIPILLEAIAEHLLVPLCDTEGDH